MFPTNTSVSCADSTPASQKTTKLDATAEATLNHGLGISNEINTNYKYNKVLVICGPTATGKTKFALEVAKKLNGELISADSRQVYVGKNLVHGKDLPYRLEPIISSLNWRDRKLKFYEIDGIKIWLYDIVNPGEQFNVSFWRECAQIVIKDILKRNKLPVVVGGTGLFIKSLTQNLSDINVPYNAPLRKQLEQKTPRYLFNYLSKIDSFRAAGLNISDKQNPRRLIRAIEIALAPPSPELRRGAGGEVLQIGLTGPREYLYQLVDKRIEDRISAGAASEDPGLAKHPEKWRGIEHGIVRHQHTWFKNQPRTAWFDISQPGWDEIATLQITGWYNKSDAQNH